MTYQNQCAVLAVTAGWFPGPNTIQPTTTTSRRSGRLQAPDLVCTKTVFALTTASGSVSTADTTKPPETFDFGVNPVRSATSYTPGFQNLCILFILIDGTIRIDEVVSASFGSGPTPGCSFLISSDALQQSYETCCQTTSGVIAQRVSVPADGQLRIETLSRIATGLGVNAEGSSSFKVLKQASQASCNGGAAA